MPNFDKIVDLLNEVEKDILISLVVQFPLCYAFLTFYVDGFTQFQLFDKVIYAVAIDIPSTLFIALFAATFDQLIGVNRIKHLSIFNWAFPVSISAANFYFGWGLGLCIYGLVPFAIVIMTIFSYIWKHREEKKGREKPTKSEQ